MKVPKTEVDELSEIESASGKLDMQFVEDKLMHSVLQSDKKSLDHAELLKEAANNNIGAFTPDMMYSQMVEHFQVAEQIMGERLIRLLTGYDPGYIEKNANIPEFQRELKNRIQETVEDLKEEGLLDHDGRVSDKGMEFSSLLLLKDLDNYVSKDNTGEKHCKRISHYGERSDTKPFRKGDRYKDIHIRKSLRQAIRRQHSSINSEDLVVSTRHGKGTISVIYALDASSSMKGDKLDACKRAGVSLAHKAIQEKDKVGLLVFSSSIKESIAPTDDFALLLNAISKIRAGRQTDYKVMIDKAIELFPPSSETKHLVIITDALPTAGSDPEKSAISSASVAFSAGITISIIGIRLDKKGKEFAKQLALTAGGRVHLADKVDQLGTIVLNEYSSI